MITQSLHGYFIQLPPEIITALNLPENASFECSLCGSVIQLTPVSDDIDISYERCAASIFLIIGQIFGERNLMAQGVQAR